MKRIFALVLFLSPLLAWAEGWIASGSITNPSSGQVMVDTGALSGPGKIAFCVYASSTAGTAIRVQHMDSANSSVLQEQLVTVPANNFQTFCPNIPITFADQERFRVIMNGAVTGIVSVSLFY